MVILSNKKIKGKFLDYLSNLELIKKAKLVYIKNLIVVFSITYLIGISISSYTLLKSGISSKITIASLILTTVLFIIIIKREINKNTEIMYSLVQKIIITDLDISYCSSNEIKKIVFNDIKKIDIIRNKKSEIQKITIIGKQRIIINDYFVDIDKIYVFLKETVDKNKFDEKRHTKLTILSGLLTVIALIILYYFRYKFRFSILGIILDKVLPITGGIILLFFYMLDILPNRKKYYLYLSIGMIIMFSYNGYSEIKDFNITRTVNIKGYHILFPFKPNINEIEMENGVRTEYRCYTGEVDYLLEYYDFTDFEINDNNMFFDSISKNYISALNSTVKNKDIKNNTMVLSLLRADQTNYNIIVNIKDNNVLVSIMAIIKNQALHSRQIKSFTNSIYKNTDFHK